MRKTKRIRLLAFALVFITALSLCNVTEAQAAVEFTKADFDYKIRDESNNIMDSSLTGDYMAIFEGKSEVVLTNKNIKLGDSLSKVQKAYGVTEKLKLDKTEEIYATMYISYPERCLNKEWKYYLHYGCEDENGRYHYGNFYFDSKNKLKSIIFYGEKINHDYTNVLYKSGIKFTAPKGKKITTKTVGGKKVYLLPKNTKITFNSKEDYDVIADISMYDNNDRQIAFTYYDANLFKNKKTYKASALVKELRAGTMNAELVDYKSLGKYKYFVMTIRPQDSKDHDRLIPELVYFKYI